LTVLAILALSAAAGIAIGMRLANAWRGVLARGGFLILLLASVIGVASAFGLSVCPQQWAMLEAAPAAGVYPVGQPSIDPQLVIDLLRCFAIACCGLSAGYFGRSLSSDPRRAIALSVVVLLSALMASGLVFFFVPAFECPVVAI
jgi:hypothetical protein